MRYGLLALSAAMLSSGVFAAQSARSLSLEATAEVTTPGFVLADHGAGYGTLKFAANRDGVTRLAMR